MVDYPEVRVRHTYNLIHAVAARVPEEEIGRLRMNPNVRYVEEEAIYVAAGSESSTEEYDNAWGIRHIFADVAHTGGNKGKGIKVAILDTGIDCTHEDLNKNYRGGYDFVFNDDDPYDDSFDGHGTHAAGIIAAEDDGIGVIGVAPEADLYAVKVLDGAGFGTAEWVIAGLDWAVQNKMHIVNLSLEGPHRQALMEACDKAYEAGLLLVAAGGNSVAGNGPVAYPAAYDSVIAVTATDALDRRAISSPTGDQLELAAPGMEIVSAVVGGGYGMASGTSAAAPHVAGLAALYWLANTVDETGDGVIDNRDVRSILQCTAIDLGEPGHDRFYGHGLANVFAGAKIPCQAFTIVRSSRTPSCDAKIIDIGKGFYDILISNASLTKVAINVFDEEILETDLSKTFYFRGDRPQEVAYSLDAMTRQLRILITPFGAPQASARITIKETIPDS